MSQKKILLKIFKKLLGMQFIDQSATCGAAAVSRSQAEISHYKGMPVIGLREKSLQWWSLNKYTLPNLAKLA